MKLEKASIVLMDEGVKHVEVNKDFDEDYQQHIITLVAVVSPTVSYHTFPDMTIADATELRDALTILIDDREEA